MSGNISKAIIAQSMHVIIYGLLLLYFYRKLHRMRIILFKKNKEHQMKNIKLTDTNKKGSLTHIMRISKMIMIKLIDSLMIMPIVKNLPINQIGLLLRGQ